MPAHHIVGDLFAQRVQALAHGVNTAGVMGAGIAVEFKKRFPVMFEDYRAACLSGSLQPGGAMPWPVDERRWVYNLATQQRPGRDARLPWVESAVTAMIEHAESHAVASIAVPRIGAGIGGLAWGDVRAVLDRVAASSPVEVITVSMPGAK